MLTLVCEPHQAIGRPARMWGTKQERKGNRARRRADGGAEGASGQEGKSQNQEDRGPKLRIARPSRSATRKRECILQFYDRRSITGRPGPVNHL